MKTSERIRQRLMDRGVSFLANDNISDAIGPTEMIELQEEVERCVTEMLRAMVIDIDNDHNMQETAKRVAKVYLQEVFAGRYQPRPSMTRFPNAKEMGRLYTVGPITVRSACSHHLVPIIGSCWVGIKPSDKVIGLSKFVRLARWVFSRPHIQEEAVVILADELEEQVKPRGLIIIVDAVHYCMKWRGVAEQDTIMTTTEMRGEIAEDPATQEEFYRMIRRV